MDNLFFIVSKLAWGILSPINLIIGLISIATILLWFNKQRAAKILLTFCLLINLPLLLYPVSDLLIFPLENRFQKPSEMPNNIDGIIILGGGEKLKVSTSWQHAEMGNGGDRYLAAASLSRHYPNAPIIFSGGSGFLRFQGTKREAHFATQLLVEHGVGQQRINIESQSRNTYENFLFLKTVLPNIEGQYLLVTSAYHMPRAVGIARKQNINVIPYPVDYRSTTASNRQWDFDLFSHLEVLEPAWREWIGLTVYFLSGKIDFIFPKSEQNSNFNKALNQRENTP
jgi:uncharacterized SAM-binding protein YcdF (DUF218 family)